MPRAAVASSPFLAACRRQPVAFTPVWFMRQAGRSLPEYRAIRAEHSFQQMITRPELAAEVTLQPVRRHGVDAAIVFSDIMTPVQSIAEGISIETGLGPVIERPFRTAADVERLRPLDPAADIPYVIETVERVVADLDTKGVPVIGFAGAPFTVATYLIEGGKSKEFEATKMLMHGETETWFALLDRLADIAIASLRAQVAAGASAVQLFDSWAGILSEREYRRFVLPASSKVLRSLADSDPDTARIHFGVGTGELLGAMAEAGADVVGVDWRVPLDVARQRVGAGVALQGNLDPVLCLSPWPVCERAARQVLADGAAAGPGYVFNLGHGVLQQTDPAVLTRLVELVHSA